MEREDPTLNRMRTTAGIWIDPSQITLETSIQLGHGGFSTVSYGTWSTLPVACKRLARSEQAMDVLDREVQILTAVRHPNVVILYGVCPATNGTSLVMEYCSQGSLRALMNERTALHAISLARRIQLLMDVAAGLEHLHSRGITHGDVKPDNVLIGSDNFAKVSDFGGSAVTGVGQSVTTRTVRWSAPEVVVGGPAASSYASDVWSFGLVCFGVITGHAPFATLRNDDAVAACLREACQYPESFKSVLDLQDHSEIISTHSGVARWLLMDVVGRCCLFNRDGRPTMREVHTLLNTALSGAVRSEPLHGINPLFPRESRTLESSTASTIPVMVSPAESPAQTALKERYMRRVRELRKRRPNDPWLYGDLKVVHVPQPLRGGALRPTVVNPGQSLENTHAWLDSHQVLAYNKANIAVHDLFAPLSGEDTAPRVVYVIGPAGIGKTTFSWQVALDDTDDAERRAPLWPQFEWKIHITLRDVAMTQRERCASRDTGIAELLFYYIFQTTGAVQSLEDMRELVRLWTPDNCLLILDGLDEVDISGSHRGLQCLLDFESATRLVTTRPHRVRQIAQFDRVVEACGFTAEQAHQYVRHAVGDSCKQLLSLMNERPYLSLHSRTPLHLRIICKLWERDRRVVENLSTMTELYDAMSRYLLVRDLSDRLTGPHGAALSPSDKEHLLSLGNKRLCDAAWMMFFGRDGGRTIEQWLSEEQYRKTMRSNDQGLGVQVLQTLSDNNPLFVERIVEEFYSETGRCYSFAHYSFQEYYCGRRMASLLMSGDRAAEAVIQRLRSDDRYSLVFQFAVGTLSGIPDGGEVMRRLFRLFLSNEYDVGRLDYLCTLLNAGNCVHTTSIGSLFMMVVEWLGARATNDCLSLAWQNIGVTGAMLVATVANRYATIRTVELRSCRIGDIGVVVLAEMLQVNTTLTSLHIRGDQITPRGVAALAAMSNVNTTLKTLELRENDITPHGAAALVDVLNQSTSLTSLDLSENASLGVEGVKAIASTLEFNNNLSELNFQDCNVNDEGAAYFAVALRNNSVLNVLNLSNNSITSEGGRMLLETVQHYNTTLRTLNLSSNSGCSTTSSRIQNALHERWYNSSHSSHSSPRMDIS